MPAVGSVSVNATLISLATAGSTNRSRCSGLAWESSGRQIPLETWTIIRSDACDIANSSSSGRYWVNGIPRPP